MTIADRLATFYEIAIQLAHSVAEQPSCRSNDQPALEPRCHSHPRARGGRLFQASFARNDSPIAPDGIEPVPRNGSRSIPWKLGRCQRDSSSATIQRFFHDLRFSIANQWRVLEFRYQVISRGDRRHCLARKSFQAANKTFADMSDSEIFVVVCLIPLLAVHLWAAACSAFAPFVLIFLEFTRRAPSSAWQQFTQALTKMGLVALLLTAVLGVCYGAIIWSPEFSNRIQALSTRIAYGIVEYLFSLLLLVVYWLTIRKRKLESTSFLMRWIRISLLFLAGTNLLYHFPILFEVLQELSRAEYAEVEQIESADFRALIVKPRVLAAAVHFMISTAIIGSSTMLGWTAWRWKRLSAESRSKTQQLCAIVTCVATSFAIPSGIIALLNGNAVKLLATLSWHRPLFWLVWISVFLAVALLPHSLMAAFAPRNNRRNLGTVFHTAAIVLLMSYLSVFLAR